MGGSTEVGVREVSFAQDGSFKSLQSQYGKRAPAAGNKRTAFLAPGAVIPG